MNKIVTRTVSVTMMKIIIPAKNSDASVKIDSLSKNSLKDNKNFSGIWFSKISDITIILLNFIDLLLILKYIKP